MRIHTDENIDVDITPDFNLSIVRNNPLMSDQGTVSLPALLPLSAKNMQLFDHPDQFKRLYKTRLRKPLYIEHGVYQKASTFVLESISSDGLDGTFLMDESEMYSKMQEMELSQVFQVRRSAADLDVSGSFANDMDKMIRYLELVMMGNIEDDFRLFPVCTDSYDVTIDNNSYTIYNILNEQHNYRNGGISDNTLPDLNGVLYFKLVGREGRMFYDSSNSDIGISVPPGYGITPFLLESYVLKRIFSYFGYTLLDYFGELDECTRNEVVINNTADAIVTGVIDYSLLVPSVTVKEFLDTVKDKYGCDFFVFSDRRAVELKTWEKILSSAPKSDLTDNVSELISRSYTSPTQFKLTFQRSTDGVTDTFDTLDKLKKAYASLPFFEVPYLPNNWIWDDRPDGIYFIKNLNQYYELYVKGTRPGSSHVFKGLKFITYGTFDYYEDKAESVSWAERSSQIEFVPLEQIYIYNIAHVEAGKDSVQIPYIGSRRHINTILNETTTEDGTSTTTTISEKADSCPVMFCYWLGRGVVMSQSDYSQYKVFGSPYGYDNSGAKLEGYFDLIPGGDNGLYARFWKKYASVILNSFHKVEYKLNLSEGQIVSLSLSELQYIDGESLLVESIEYTIDKDAIKVSKVVYRTLKIYKDPE